MAWYWIILIAIAYVAIAYVTANLWGKHTIMRPKCAMDEVALAWIGCVWPISLFILPAAWYDHEHGND